MIKIAFIDVQNTETTALKWLRFSIDWQKLTIFLKHEWGCERVYYYLGIQEGDTRRSEEFNALTAIGAIVRPKFYFVHKISDKVVSTVCPLCTEKIVIKVGMGYSWKCNCDVELTSDVLEEAGMGTELLLFTGDGDFQFLIEKALNKKSTLSIVSTSKPRMVGGKNEYRLSKKLKKMNKIRILELDNLKKKIEI